MPKLRTRSHCIGLNAQAQHRIGRKPDANAYCGLQTERERMLWWRRGSTCNLPARDKTVTGTWERTKHQDAPG